MMPITKRVALIVAGLLLAAISAKAANNAEQVVFSTPGFIMDLSGNAKDSTPFGFWIWCAAGAAAPSQGGYQNANVCQGSMYFYALDKHATHVIGFVGEGPDGIYTMQVVQGTPAQLFSGTLNPAYTCSLANTVPDPKGPGNSVAVNCLFLDPSLGGGAGTATVTNAVVNVTGP